MEYKKFNEIKDEFNNKMKDKNLIMMDERFIQTNSKRRREFLIKNNNTDITYWVQQSRIYQYNYSSIRYNRMSFEELKKYISNITKKEYELLEKPENFKSTVNIKHNICGNTHKYRITHFINDSTRCDYCLRISKMTKIEDFKKHLKEISNGTLILEDNYNGYHNKVKLRCSNCDWIFESAPVNLDRQFKDFGETHCPNCQVEMPIGERYIFEYLVKNDIHFKYQYRFTDCMYKKPLVFDFVLINNDKVIGAIEYDGRQHFNPDSKYFSEDNIVRDEIKNNYCKDKEIPLLRTKKTTRILVEEELEKFINDINVFNDYPTGGEIPQ